MQRRGLRSVTAARRENFRASSLSLSLVSPRPNVSLPPSPTQTHTGAQISATGARFPWGAIPMRPPRRRFDCAGPPFLPPPAPECTDRRAPRVRAPRRVHTRRDVCPRVIGCVAIVNEIVRSYAGRNERGSSSSGDDWSS